MPGTVESASNHSMPVKSGEERFKYFMGSDPRAQHRGCSQRGRAERVLRLTRDEGSQSPASGQRPGLRREPAANTGRMKNDSAHDVIDTKDRQQMLRTGSYFVCVYWVSCVPEAACVFASLW